MVQIVNVDPKPSIWAALGQGLGQGISSGISAGMSYKVQDMLDQKKTARLQESQGRKGLAALKILKPEATEQEQAAAYALGPEQTVKIMEMMGGDALSRLYSLSGVEPSQTQTPQSQQPQTAQQQFQGFQAQQMQQPQQQVNIQGMPGMQNVGPRMSPVQMNQQIQPQQPPMMLDQNQIQQQPQAVTAPMTQQTQAPRPQMMQQSQQQRLQPEQLSDEDWSKWMAGQRMTMKQMKEANAFRKQRQETAFKQRDVELKERKDVREQARFEREMQETPADLKPYVADVEAKRASSVGRDNSVRLAEQAIRSGNTSGFVQHFIETRGFDPLKSENAALLDVAAKEFTLGNIRRAGSRPNQWIEQQIRNMFPKVGRSEVANLVTLEATKLENDINKKEVEIYDRLSEEDYSKKGRLGRDIRKRVDNELKQYVGKRSNLAAIKMQEIREEKKDEKTLQGIDKVPKGTPLTPRRIDALIKKFDGDVDKAAKTATKLGFKVYEVEGE